MRNRNFWLIKRYRVPTWVRESISEPFWTDVWTNLIPMCLLKFIQFALFKFQRSFANDSNANECESKLWGDRDGAYVGYEENPLKPDVNKMFSNWFSLYINRDLLEYFTPVMICQILKSEFLINVPRKPLVLNLKPNLCM